MAVYVGRPFSMLADYPTWLSLVTFYTSDF
jgi:hypothetical protein